MGYIELEASAEPISSSISGMEVEVETSDDTETSSNDIDARYSYSDVANYLSSGIYPAGANKATKSGLRKQSKVFTVEDGHLHSWA